MATSLRKISGAQTQSHWALVQGGLRVDMGEQIQPNLAYDFRVVSWLGRASIAFSHTSHGVTMGVGEILDE